MPIQRNINTSHRRKQLKCVSSRWRDADVTSCHETPLASLHLLTGFERSDFSVWNDSHLAAGLEDVTEIQRHPPWPLTSGILSRLSAVNHIKSGHRSVRDQVVSPCEQLPALYKILGIFTKILSTITSWHELQSCSTQETICHHYNIAKHLLSDVGPLHPVIRVTFPASSTCDPRDLCLFCAMSVNMS